MPRSNSQTSPRAGIILLGVEQSEELVGGVGGFHVVQRARIQREGPAQEFCRENPFFVRRQSLVRFEEECGLLAHNFRLPRGGGRHNLMSGLGADCSLGQGTALIYWI